MGWIKYGIGIGMGFLINTAAIFMLEKSFILPIYLAILFYILMALLAVFIVNRLQMTGDGFTVAYIIGSSFSFIYYDTVTSTLPNHIALIMNGIICNIHVGVF